MQPFQRALRGLAGLALAALVAVPVTVATTVGGAEHDTPHGSVTSILARRVTTPAAQAPDPCHGPGALIRTPAGVVRHVGLVRGLRTYQRHRPGTFLRLCGATPATPATPAAPQGP